MSGAFSGSRSRSAFNPYPRVPTTTRSTTKLLSWRSKEARPGTGLRSTSSSSSTSSFRAKGAVEEGGFVVAKQGSFYELLGISEEGSFEEIKSAYKRMALRYHPDVSPPERADEHTRRFIEVQELTCGLHLAFSSRRPRPFDEELEERSGWKNRWQDQVAELKRRSMTKDSDENLSWGARMRRKRAESWSE
ncbi:chaperone protein dnaJ 20, chloroplastic-like [Ananas comosus]|uniref:Chaperone protein dnaJ 20, chloroplastic-like n=1 Tax=Ananas comosus TaxID=4615 RepID=A0A6P5GGS9_ANACO|nr:chaperone protein dnaJ 20, chloroplastic-like [Ananas comosus]